MSQYAVVYWSSTGNTESLAKAIEEGIKSTGNDATLIPASDFTESDVAKYDGIAFGCSAQGAEALEEGEFEPMWNTVSPSLKDKKVALFGSYGWGGGEFLETWKSQAESDGISIVDTATCENTPDDEALEKATALGKTLAG